MSQVKARFFSNNFTNGIITPLLYARSDYKKFLNSVKDLKNFYIWPHGGISFVRGTEYVREAKPELNTQWELVEHNVSGIHKPIAYSNTLRRFVILPQDSDGTNTVMYADNNLENWTEVEAFGAIWEAVIFVEPWHLYIAVASDSIGGASSDDNVMISPNGINWFSVNMGLSAGNSQKWRSLDYSPSLNMVVAISNDSSGGQGQIAYTQDGINWTEISEPSTQNWYTVRWAEFLGKWVAIAQGTGGGSNNLSMTSADGINWGVVDTQYDRVWQAMDVSESNETIIAISGGGELTNTIIKGTDDGNGNLQWASLGQVPETNNWAKLVHSERLDKWVAVSSDGSNRVMASVDNGANWISESHAGSDSWEDLIWTSQEDMFVSASTTSLMRYGGGTAEEKTVRYAEFVFSNDDALVLEFGNKYVRFHDKDGTVTETPQGITNITKANPAVVTYNGTDNYSNGNRILIQDVVGMTEVNNREFEVQNINTSSNTFELAGVDSSSYTSYDYGGEVGKIVEVTTPYLGDDLDGLQWPPTQSADVLYLTHSDYQTRKLSRTSSDNTTWTLTLFDPIPPPTSVQDTDLSETTSIDSITFSSTTATATISAGHPYLDDMYVTIANANESVYNGTFQISNVTSTTFDYTMGSTPAVNATGSPVVSASTLKPAAKTGDNIVFVSGDAIFLEGDVGRNIVYGTSKATITETLPTATDSLLKAISSITHSGTTATATSSAHGYSNGDKISVQGANESEYNGQFKISNKTTNTFDYEMDSNPGKDATGDQLVCYKSIRSTELSSLTQSNNVATATTSSAHGYSTGDYVKVKNANESDYNGTFHIYDVTSTTFKYNIENDPSSPATGSPHCKLKSPTNAVVCDIIEDFPNTDTIPASDWVVTGSPEAELTFPKRGGGSNDMMSVDSDVHAFRTADIGKYIRFPRSDSGTYATFEIIKFKKANRVKVKKIKRIHKDDDLTVDAGNWFLESNQWSDDNGWPTASAFYQDRLWFGRDIKCWASATSDYENFSLGDKDDNAMEFSFLSREINNIVWMQVKNALIIGTTGGEWQIGSTDSDETITPTNIKVIKYTNQGSRQNVQAIQSSQSVIFVQGSGTKVREYKYDFGTDGYLSNDITIHAEHLFKYKIKRIVLQKEPIPIIWVLSESGELIGCTYMPEQEVIGWFRINFAYGYTDDICVVPSEKFDVLYVSILRSINGTIRRYLEKLQPCHLNETDSNLTNGLDRFLDNVGSTYANGYYFDYTPEGLYVDSSGKAEYFVGCGVQKQLDSAVSEVTGLWHLNGMEVKGTIDGNEINNAITVSNGKATLPAGASNINIGLPYTGSVRLIPPVAQLDDGSTEGIIKRIISMYVRIYGSSTFKFGNGSSSSNLQTAEFITYDNTSYTLWSGDSADSGVLSHHRREPDIYIVQDRTFPLNIISINLEGEVLSK